MSKKEITIKFNAKIVSVIIGIIISLVLLGFIICEGILFSYYLDFMIYGYTPEYMMDYAFGETYTHLFSLLLGIFAFIGLWIWIRQYTKKQN